MGLVAMAGWLLSFILVEGKGFARVGEFAVGQQQESRSPARSSVTSETSTRSPSPSR